MQKLNQVIAVEKGVKNRVNKTVDELYKQVQRPVSFDGFSKTYQPSEEEGEQHAPESRKVQAVAKDILRDIASAMSELFDIECTKDNANCLAKADVVVDGNTLLEGVPATYLLFLDKQLTDLNTIVGKIPTLDSAEDWKQDGASGMHRTASPVRTRSTKKVQKPIVLYDATDKHPAQTAMIAEDITVGHWENTKFSGALADPDKKALLLKIEKLRVAVKYARERANATEAEAKKAGENLFSWLLS